MSLDQPWDRSGLATWGGLYDLGPISQPPRVPYVGVVDRVTAVTYFLNWSGSAVTLTTTKLPSLNYTIYQPYDGPFLGHGVRAYTSSGVLAFDKVPGNSLSAVCWLIPPVPGQETYPEPTNYPATPPPVIPGIPSSTVPPTGGGYAAFLAAWETNTPNFLTAIIVGGVAVPAVYSTGSSAWVTPAGVVIPGGPT